MRAQSEPADRKRRMPKSAACYASHMSEVTVARQAVIHRGRRLEYFTILCNSREGLSMLNTKEESLCYVFRTVYNENYKFGSLRGSRKSK
jgi:hypothetical protein